MNRTEINNVDIRHIFDVTKITGFYLMILVRHLDKVSDSTPFTNTFPV
ncbi:hypothetical protein SPPR111872_15310 [Sphingobacterium prati]